MRTPAVRRRAAGFFSECLVIHNVKYRVLIDKIKLLCALERTQCVKFGSFGEYEVNNKRRLEEFSYFVFLRKKDHRDCAVLNVSGVKNLSEDLHYSLHLFLEKHSLPCDAVRGQIHIDNITATCKLKTPIRLAAFQTFLNEKARHLPDRFFSKLSSVRLHTTGFLCLRLKFQPAFRGLVTVFNTGFILFVGFTDLPLMQELCESFAKVLFNLELGEFQSSCLPLLLNSGVVPSVVESTTTHEKKERLAVTHVLLKQWKAAKLKAVLDVKQKKTPADTTK